ncbi:SREBP regulating gene protein [Zerene cesonia]|uniref:SREBP regulating gene protein n=1 Tax=Zerene cesonia TaxID=33412 RepID=UPI0018E4FABA|nr:SREBP regulating gene protein [Zerene cesonia]
MLSLHTLCSRDYSNNTRLIYIKMWYAAILRFIRRPLVLGIIFASSLTYCIVSFLREGTDKNMIYQDVSLEQKPFVWRTLQEHNETVDVECRNSVQGRALIVDDRGYVCQRNDVGKNGCCIADAEETSRYSCTSCNANHCCIVYEYCVSCCLDPNKRNMLQVVLSKLTVEEHVLVHSLADDYELCLTKCRTSSHSVLHENSYKNPGHKHCYSDTGETKTQS